jgi:membrane-bound serine protease (ClpP class)
MPADRTEALARKTSKRSRWRAVALLIVVLVAALTTSTAAEARRAVVLEIDGAIGPAIADYVSRELAAVRPSDTSLVILRMDTPGGLDASMREIILENNAR